MKFYKLTLNLFFILSNTCFAQAVVYQHVLRDENMWVIEQQPEGSVLFSDNFLEVDDEKGCTVWFKNKLESPVKIQYDITAVDAGGTYDRVSDLNCFWMANDPNNPYDFFKDSEKRTGYFPNYHHLKLYYVGYGGHNNTKTRFRRYNGNINRPLLPGDDLSGNNFMITPNKKMHIEIVVVENYTSFSRDGETIFEMHDQNPYLSGYFGFRTVNNHMIIENFKILKL